MLHMQQMPRGCVKYTAGCWFQLLFNFHNIWDVILPIDELIFFGGVGVNHQPAQDWSLPNTSHQVVAPGAAGGGAPRNSQEHSIYFTIPQSPKVPLKDLIFHDIHIP